MAGSMLLPVISLFELPVSLRFSFGGPCVLRKLPFLLGCWIAWHIIPHSVLLRIFLYFCDIGSYFSFFISYFVYLDLLSLLGEPGQRLVNFVYTFRESALGLLYFFFLISYLFSVNGNSNSLYFLGLQNHCGQ